MPKLTPAELDALGLRPATPNDYMGWLREQSRDQKLPDFEETSFSERFHFDPRPMSDDFYLATRDFTLPPLYGANALNIIIPPGVHVPTGNPGHTQYFPSSKRFDWKTHTNIPIYSDPAFMDDANLRRGMNAAIARRHRERLVGGALKYMSQGASRSGPQMEEKPSLIPDPVDFTYVHVEDPAGRVVEDVGREQVSIRATCRGPYVSFVAVGGGAMVGAGGGLALTGAHFAAVIVAVVVAWVLAGVVTCAWERRLRASVRTAAATERPRRITPRSLTPDGRASRAYDIVSEATTIGREIVGTYAWQSELLAAQRMQLDVAEETRQVAWQCQQIVSLLAEVGVSHGERGEGARRELVKRTGKLRASQNATLDQMYQWVEQRVDALRSCRDHAVRLDGELRLLSQLEAGESVADRMEKLAGSIGAQALVAREHVESVTSQVEAARAGVREVAALVRADVSALASTITTPSVDK